MARGIKGHYQFPAKLGWSLHLALGNMRSLDRDAFTADYAHYHFPQRGAVLISLAGACIVHQIADRQYPFSVILNADKHTERKIFAMEKASSLELDSAVRFFYGGGGNEKAELIASRIEDEFKIIWDFKWKRWDGWKAFDKVAPVYQRAAELLTKAGI